MTELEGDAADSNGVTLYEVEREPETPVFDHALNMDAAIRKYNTVFCVCSYEMLHTDLGGIAEGQSKLFLPWDVLMIDEAHKFRNGVTRHMDRKGDDAGRTNTLGYQRLQETIIRHFKPRLLAISATPVVNHQMDIYSLLLWANMDPKHLTKDQWLTNGTVDFKKNVAFFRKNHLVNIKVPPVPPVTSHSPELRRSHFELNRAKHFYGQLHLRCKEFMSAVKKVIVSPSEASRNEANAARKRWLAAMTRSAMEELWPGVYTVHFPKKDDGSPAPPQYSTVCAEFAASAELPRLEQCSKFNWVIQKAKMLNELAKTDVECSRVVIFCQFAAPLVLLKRLLKKHVPNVPVFEHLGSLTRVNKTKNIKSFFATKHGGILLATRASMGVGINLDCARTIFKLDNDWSKALEDQATGRIVRPLVQEKHEWHEYTPIFGDALHPSAEPFCMQKWMRKVMDSKNLASFSVLTEGIDEITDDVEAESGPIGSSDGSSADDAQGKRFVPLGSYSRMSAEDSMQTLAKLQNMLTMALVESTPNVVHRKKIRLPPRKTVPKTIVKKSQTR